MQLTRKELKARSTRRLIVNAITIVISFTVFALVLYSMQPLILPVILGVFFAYVFRPLLQFKGSVSRRYFRAFIIIGTLSTLGYMSVRLVRQSLPTEKQKLELMVRLQYQLNNRYRNWMGLTEKPEGNAAYKMFASELNPMIHRVNDYLSMSLEQRQLFLKYVGGYQNEEKVSQKYYDYFLSNLKIIQEVEVEREIAADIEAKIQHDKVVAGDSTKKESSIGHLLKLFSIWIVFPLTFMFMITDKGQILHFLMKLVPNRYFELTMNVFDHVDSALGKYIRGTAIECALVGATLIVGFWMVGLPFKIAILIGMIGGLTNAIPFVGTLIACAIGASYSLIVEDISPIVPFITENNLMIAVLAVVMVAHLLDNAIYQPLVVGGAVNIHPLAVILGVFGGSLAFGFAGLLLAIPTIVVTKVVVQQFFRGLRAYKII
ncbi:MAG: AI-2E family transporter [Bdellovibrionota bacterium]